MRLQLLVLSTLVLSLGRSNAVEVLRPKLEVPRTTMAPRMDANLDDPAWKNAALIASLSMSVGPDAKGKAPLPTMVKTLWDEKFLYFRFECHDKEIHAPFAGGEAGRDANHYQGDVVEIFLDPVGDAQQYIELQVSPKNGVFDALFLLTTKAESDLDGVLKREIIERDSWTFPSWNIEGLRTATSLWENGNGWTADIALPAAPLLKRLGLRTWQSQSLRANFLRYDSLLVDAKRELIAMNWSPIMWGRPHRSPQAMGYLELHP
jgi:hypothetical protein